MLLAERMSYYSIVLGSESEITVSTIALQINQSRQSRDCDGYHQLDNLSDALC